MSRTIRATAPLWTALLCSAVQAQTVADPVDRTEKFLRGDAKPPRIARSKAAVDESKFSARGFKRWVSDQSSLAIPNFTFRPGGTAYGASLARSVSPRSKYYYVDRVSGKPLNPRAQPTDKASEVQYFEGDGQWALFALISGTRSDPNAGPARNRAGGLLSVQLNRDQDRLQFGLNLFGSTSERGTKFFSPSLDITDNRSIPGVCLTFTTNFNQLWGNGFADYGWTFDLNADTSVSLSHRTRLGISSGYTFPSRFGGQYDFFVRAAVPIGDGKKLRIKWGRDNAVTIDVVIRF